MKVTEGNYVAYVLHVPELPQHCKLGIAAAAQFRQRLANLQSGNPFKLNVYATFNLGNQRLAAQVERLVLHRTRAAATSGGTEWRNMTPQAAADLVRSAIAERTRRK